MPLAYVLLGAVIILAIRFATYNPPVATHYHANYAVYINGVREDYKGPQYYEDVAACSTQESNNPKTRTHMHSNINDVIHVHDKASTWGHFFSNIGWTLGNSSITTRDGTTYSEDANNKLHIILNGQDYTGLGGITNMVINSEDKLLISYGNESTQQAMQKYKMMGSSAQKANDHPDPKACTGRDDRSDSFADRLRHMF